MKSVSCSKGIKIHIISIKKHFDIMMKRLGKLKKKCENVIAEFQIILEIALQEWTVKKKNVCDVGSRFEKFFLRFRERVTKMIEDLRKCDNEVIKEIQHPDGLYSWRKYRINWNKLIVKEEENKNFLGRY